MMSETKVVSYLFNKEWEDSTNTKQYKPQEMSGGHCCAVKQYSYVKQ